MGGQEDAPIDPAHRLVAGQEALTPAQEAEMQRFTDAYIQTQLSTEPVDEREAEALVERAYVLAGLDAPAAYRVAGWPTATGRAPLLVYRAGRASGQRLAPSAGATGREHV